MLVMWSKDHVALQVGASHGTSAPCQQSFTKYLRQTYFSCEIAHYGKSSISVFPLIFTSTDKFSFCNNDWPLGNNSIKFWDLPDIS